MNTPSRKPGLPSLNDARETRKRQIVMGRAVIGGIPPKWFLGGIVLILGIFAATFFQAQGELTKKKSELLARQRAVKATLGPKLFPIRDVVEKGFKELTTTKDEFILPDEDFSKVLSSPAIYLRLMRKDTANPALLRRAAADYSLRDGFTSCLLRDPKAVLPTAGAACEKSTDCQAGEICTEFKVCQRPSSPFNMRLVYKALFVLSEDWEREVKNASSDISLRTRDLILESTTRVDIPAAIEVYQRAKLAVLVVDETVGLPKALGEPGDESEFERLARTPHDASVGLFALPSGKLLAKLRGRAEGALRSIGAPQEEAGPFADAARARQANSCALALEVKSKLSKPALRETP